MCSSIPPLEPWGVEWLARSAFILTACITIDERLSNCDDVRQLHCFSYSPNLQLSHLLEASARLKFCVVVLRSFRTECSSLIFYCDRWVSFYRQWQLHSSVRQQRVLIPSVEFCLLMFSILCLSRPKLVYLLSTSVYFFMACISRLLYVFYFEEPPANLAHVGISTIFSIWPCWRCRTLMTRRVWLPVKTVCHSEVLVPLRGRGLTGNVTSVSGYCGVHRKSKRVE